MNFDEGVLYVATGEKYIQEAITSAESVKEKMEETNITLITDKKIDIAIFDRIKVKKFDSGGWKNNLVYKIRGMMSTPYRKTVFLDTDTFVVNSFQEIFDAIGDFSILMALAPADISSYDPSKSKLNIQNYNTGVIGYEKNSEVKKMMKEWAKEYSENKKNYENDQAALTKIISSSRSVSIGNLSSQYNARTNLYQSFPPGEVKILHGRHKKYRQISNRINSAKSNRVWSPILQDIISIGPSITPLKILTKCVKRIVRGRN